MVKVKRLRNKKLIKKLLLTGKIYKSEKYKIYYISSNTDFYYAISVSKKLGNAVLRNREKRWIRSAIYQNCTLFKKGGFAFIIIKESGGLFSNVSEEIISFIKQNY